MAEQSTQQAQPQLRFTAHHYREKGVDEQAFAKWYTEEQMPRMIRLVQKHGIKGYNLYFTPESIRATFQPDMDNLKGIPGWKFAPFDVTASIWGEPDQLRALLSDPEWHSKVIAFEKGWIDTERAETQIGWETDFLKDGKIVNVKELKDYN